MRKLAMVLTMAALVLVGAGRGGQIAWASGHGSHVAAVQKVNVNTAGVEELTAIKGVGEKTALAIIAYRDRNGPFGSVEDLLQIKGIGEKKLAVLREVIVLD